MNDLSEYLDGLNLPEPLDAARASAYQTLRDNHAFRDEVRNGDAILIPSAVLNQDSSITICQIRVDELRMYLRVIENEEAARAAAAESLEPKAPGFLGPEFDAMYPDGVPVPDKICLRIRPV